MTAEAAGPTRSASKRSAEAASEAPANRASGAVTPSPAAKKRATTGGSSRAPAETKPAGPVGSRVPSRAKGRPGGLALPVPMRPGDGGPLGGTPSRARELRRQGRETLRRLLEAAITVFGERGYNAARVDDIVRAARTSHGTFYLYFSNKEDLFRTLVTGVSEEMRELAEDLPSVRPGRAGHDQLYEWVSRFYDLYAHYYPVIRAWTELNTMNTELARTGTFVLRRFIDVLVQRVREIDPTPVADPETAAMALLSMVERSTYYAVTGLVPVGREDLVENLATILHAGLFGGSRRKRPV